MSLTVCILIDVLCFILLVMNSDPSKIYVNRAYIGYFINILILEWVYSLSFFLLSFTYRKVEIHGMIIKFLWQPLQYLGYDRKETNLSVDYIHSFPCRFTNLKSQAVGTNEINSLQVSRRFWPGDMSSTYCNMYGVTVGGVWIGKWVY